MATLSPDRFNALLSAIRNAPDRRQRLAAEVQLHHAALDHLPPDQAARLVAQSSRGHQQATRHLCLTLCPPAAPPPPAPAPITPTTPVWPLPSPPATLLQPDPPDAVHRSYSSWLPVGLIPPDLPAVTLAAAYTRLHGRRPMRCRGVAVYGLMELGRVIRALKACRTGEN